MIGLIGANGKIGSEISSALKKLLPDTEIKYGCRRPNESTTGIWHTVDISDKNSLKSFIGNCRLLINASGSVPAFIPDIPLVELGNQEYCRKIKNPESYTLLYGCGSVPGIIGMIPRFLAEETGAVNHLRMDYLINEPLSMTAALDMTESYSFPSSKKTGVSKNIAESVPFIGDSVYRYHFSDDESRGVSKLLNVADSEWAMIRETDDLERILSMPFKNRQELAERLYTFSHVQRQGLENSIQFLTELQGENKTITCFAKSASPSALSGKVCASVAAAVIQGNIDKGVSLLSLCKGWKTVWSLLMLTEPFDLWAVYPCRMTEIIEEEGEL